MSIKFLVLGGFGGILGFGGGGRSADFIPIDSWDVEWASWDHFPWRIREWPKLICWADPGVLWKKAPRAMNESYERENP